MMHVIAFYVGVVVIVLAVGGFVLAKLDRRLTAPKKGFKTTSITLVIPRSKYWNRGNGNLFCFIADEMRRNGMDPAKPFVLRDWDFFVYQRPLIIIQDHPEGLTLDDLRRAKEMLDNDA